MDTYIMVSLALLAFAFWKRETWIYVVAGVSLIINAIFAFQNNLQNTLGYEFAWIYIMLALICIMSPLWNRERKD